jgi:acyl-ACP thioesterase
MSSRFRNHKTPKRITSNYIFSLLKEFDESKIDILLSLLKIAKTKDDHFQFKGKRLMEIQAPDHVNDAVNLGTVIDIVSEIKSEIYGKMEEQKKSLEARIIKFHPPPPPPANRPPVRRAKP